jgi:hypothetical protein
VDDRQLNELLPRVLIVDDHEVLTEALALALRLPVSPPGAGSPVGKPGWRD